MFGENGIYGKSYHKMIDKNRIIIPLSTNVEAKEELCFIEEDELTFKICSLKELKRIVIPKYFLEKYNIKKELIFQGTYNHIKVFSSDENYKKYMKKLKK